MSERSKENISNEMQRIAENFQRKLGKQGIELEGAGPGKDGTPTISFYVHGEDCPARRSKGECNCRDTSETA